MSNNPSLGYLFSCAVLAYLSLSAIRNVPLLPLVVAPLVASGIEYAADGPRYKAIGNSMAVPVMRWIGKRIEQVERLTAEAIA